MPVAGLVLTLNASVAEQAPLMAALSGTPGVTLGVPEGSRLPLVLETASQQALDAAFRDLGAVQGVLCVELAFADFSDLDQFTDYAPTWRTRKDYGGDDGSA